MTQEREKPTVQISGEDGNIFFIVGRCQRALRRAGYGQDEIERFAKEVTATRSYDEALRVVMDWVDAE